MPTHIRETGAWRTIIDSWVRVGGQWRLVTEIYVKVNGSWRLAYQKEQVVMINSSDNNIDLLTMFESQYGAAQSYTRARFVFDSGVRIGSTSSFYACDVGIWPTGAEVLLDIQSNVYVSGRGGDGGAGVGAYSTNSPAGDGGNGGPAFRTQSPVTIDNQGVIQGGGGGGGGAGINDDESGDAVLPGGGGGGGAGRSGGQGGDQNNSGADDLEIPEGGTLTSGGDGGNTSFEIRGGDGGDPAQSGQKGTDSDSPDYPAGSGGSPGNAIVGNSLVTFTNTGTIHGSQVS